MTSFCFPSGHGTQVDLRPGIFDKFEFFWREISEARPDANKRYNTTLKTKYIMKRLAASNRLFADSFINKRAEPIIEINCIS